MVPKKGKYKTIGRKKRETASFPPYSPFIASMIINPGNIPTLLVRGFVGI